MPQRQLKISSDEAFDRASSLAHRLGRTTTDVVVEALRRYETETATAPSDAAQLTEEQQQRFDRIMALAREVSRHKLPGVTSDHTDMYDEYGLPI